MASSSAKNAKGSAFGGGGKISGKGQPTLMHSPDVEAAALESIPLMRSKDNEKLLPVYTTALQLSVDDYLAPEDLDNIQLELEKLLSNVALRYRVLKSEFDAIDKDDRRNDRRAKNVPSASAEKPVSPLAASSAATAGPSTSSANNKRKRDETVSMRKPKNTHTSTQKNLKVAKNSPAAANVEDIVEVPPSPGPTREKQVPKTAVPKNDMPNKFWLSVEPYCMPLTNEDLRLLDDLQEQYAGPLVPPIPELGEHYSTVWAAEDLKEVQSASSTSAASNRLKQQNNAPAAMLQKADSAMGECVTGQLTQRLVTALIDEQLIPNANEQVAGEASSSNNENTQATSQMNLRSLSMMRNCIGIEKRVKKELIEQGILEASDFPNNDEDEIHGEIKRLVAELTSIAEFNSSSLKRLHDTAAGEIKRLEIKRKLDTIDQEILNTYKRNLQNKVKRKTLTAEEQQEIFRLTAEQKALSDQLERLQSNYFIFE